MLSERERLTLAAIERHLVESDPELAGLFAHSVPHRRSSPLPTFLLVTGVILMILGSMLVTASVAVTGIAFAVTALGLAYFRSGQGRPSPA